MKTYRILKAVADVLGSTIVTVDVAFHRAIEKLDSATTKIGDAAGAAAVRKTNKVVRIAVQREVLLRRAADELAGRAEEAWEDVEYTIAEQHDVLIEALEALPSLNEELKARLEQAKADVEANSRRA